MASSLMIRSYAKINWTLDVLYRRQDAFHEIRTVYQTVSLFDRLDIESAEDGIWVDCNDPRVPRDDSNLVHRAASALKQAVGTRAGARIRIEKHIPVGGGLGGGSSNAAATLMGLTRLWGLGCGFDLLFEVSKAMGSDVPFFLVGGTMLGAGRGEEIYPLPEVNCDTLLLVNPGTSVSTGSAYQGLKRLTTAQSDRIIPFTILAANGIRKLPLEVWNDLEESVLVTNPEIDEVKRRLMALGARRALMSGSGATVFGVFENSAEVQSAESKLRSDGIWCKHVVTLDRAEYQRSVFES
jgi:4-diphosphocytidyl-2-C-methyl-D-erythritol kinase